MAPSITLSAEDLSSLFTTIYCGNSALTILFFDWLLCLDQEVACVWKARGGLNAGSLVYAFSRFPLMIGLVFNTVTIFPLSLSMLTLVARHSCRLAVWAGNSLVLLSRFSIGMFSAFRVFAVSGRKIIPTLGVSLLSTVPIINSLIMYGGGFTIVKVLPSPLYCSNINTLSSQWTFSILALLNVLQIILTAVSLDAIDAKESYVTIFIDPISSILTCRFILNLRQVSHSRMPSTMMSLGGDVHFAAQGSRSTLPRFVAPFGEPLHTDLVESEEGDEVDEVDEGSGNMYDSSTARDEVDMSA
ncbi:hypothetical protein GSI_04985 [Ganoderma sinense ZZ0214-1]|uniref:DUF6533 domain-containing protein n=1 Tax=Ganoderma sinense ZZ0214-1 TaxID=1077348 RepID=A0A2G8SGP0_9APHY|nr:hypothetical protein GSI_04985 [Ganoderma sinense ZZ0214-1]